jgi:uncharacterized spore protein YtfJ
MSIEELVKQVANIKDAATVKRVFGDPIEVGKKTFVPIASVQAGFGAGFGREKGKVNAEGEEGESGEGTGGGGYMKARPVAVVEITEGETTVHHIIDHHALIVGGVIMGAVFLFTKALFGRRSD